MRISTAGKHLGIIRNLENLQYLPHYRSDNSFKGTTGNRALSSFHGGSLEITLTVPLNLKYVLQGILYTSLKLNLTHERKKEKEETKLPRGRTGKIQGTGDILSELEMNAENEIQENNTTPFPEPLEEDTEEEMKRVESVQQDPGYDDNDPNEIDKDGNRRKDKKIRGQGFKEDLKLDDTGKESENKVKEKEKSISSKI